MIILGIVAFLAVGLALGLLGGGGGILAVPLLVYLLGVSPKAAVPLSLAVVGISAAAGAWARWRRGELRIRTVALFAVCSTGAAWLAPKLTSNLPDRSRMTVAIVTMLVAAIAMWLRSRRGASQQRAEPIAQPNPWKIIPAALTAGALTGIIGVGGGFLIVPSLHLFLAMPMPLATATSLGVIVLNTVAAGLSYSGQVEMNLGLLAAIVTSSLIGMALGTRLAPRFTATTLSRSFAVLLVVVSAFMAWREFFAPVS